MVNTNEAGNQNFVIYVDVRKEMHDRHSIEISFEYIDIYRESVMFKGLRPVLEGFVVPMREDACKQEVKSHKFDCFETTYPDRSVLITIITWHIQFHAVKVSNRHVKGAYVLEARAVSRAPAIVTSRGAPCRLTIPVVKGRCAREALPHAFNIGVFKHGKETLPQ